MFIKFLFRNELPLIEYLMAIGNYNEGYIYTGLFSSGEYNLVQMLNLNLLLFNIFSFRLVGCL